MAFDQNITYRVNIDDSNMQAKLSMMRASIDMAVGGGGFGGGGFNPAMMMYGGMGPQMGGFGMGAMADFGSQVRPVSYTPPAIAMQPHFGMIQVQQTLAQAGLASMGGPFGVGLSGFMTNFRQGGIQGLITGPNAIPENISMAHYMALSARGYGDRIGDAAAMTAVTAAALPLSIGAGGLGALIGSSAFSSGIMRGVGGLVGGAVGAAGVSQYVGAVTDMLAENRAIQSSLAAGSFRFFTGSGGEVDRLTGRGMGRRTRADVASSIQGMELQDLRYGITEYQQILEGSMQFDLFSGTRDAQDFKTKFKNIVDTLKTVTTTLHTSLQEGLEVMRGFRDMGVTDMGEVSRLTMASEMRGRMSGRTGMEMMSIGQAGAEIFRGTGIDMRRGFELNQMYVGNIRSALNAGTLSREMVAQAGGENALAQQMTAGALSSFQTAYGRAAMMANFDPSTGTLRPDMVNRLAGNDIMGQISRAAGMGPGGLLQFQARQEMLISEMSPEQMQMYGIASRSGMARMFMQWGLNFEDAYRVSSQNAGMSRAQIETDLALLKTDPEKMKQDQQQAADTMRVQASLEDVRNRFNIAKKISNVVRGTIVDPVKEELVNMTTSIGDRIETMSLSATGVALSDPRLTSRGLVEAGEQLLATQGETGGAIDVGGTTYQNLVGGQTGRGLYEQIVSRGTRGTGGTISYQGITAREFESREAADEVARREGIRLRGATVGDKFVAITDEDTMKLQDKSRSMQSTQEEVDRASKQDLKKSVGMGLAEIGMRGDGLNHALGVMFGGKGLQTRDFDDLSDDEFKKRFGETKGYYAAMAQRYFDKYGGLSPEAAKEFKEHKELQKQVSDQQARARSVTLEQGEAALSSLTRELASDMPVSTWFGGTVKDASGRSKSILELAQEKPEIALALMGKGSRAERMAAAAEHLGGYTAGLEDVIGRIDRGMSPERRSRVQELIETVQKSGAMGSRIAQEMTGSDAVGAKALGQVSTDIMDAVQKQSDQLIANYKQLIALQNELNRLRGGVGAPIQ